MTEYSHAPQMRRLSNADRSTVIRASVELIRQDCLAFFILLFLNFLAAGIGIVGPFLMGQMINVVQRGADVASIDRLAFWFLTVAVTQILLSRYTLLTGYRFGERMVARVRERFVDRTLALPISVVERAGTGDLAVRGTN